MTVPDQVEGAGPAFGEKARPSALRVTFASPLYRGATVAVFLGAVGYSAAAPQIASFLVDDLGASLRGAGLFYLTNLTAPVAGYLVGRRSDRSGRRLGLFRLCALLGFVGWLGIAYSTRLWMPYVLSAVIGAFGGAATSQLFAAIHDQLTARAHPNGDGVVSVVRMALTGGWVIGPVSGSFLAARTSLRAMLVATAFCTLAQIAPLGTLRTVPGTGRTSPSPSPEAQPGAPGVRAMLPLLTFTGLYVLVYLGEPVKYAYLPIYMTDRLDFPAGLSGAVIGIQPLVELILLPLAVRAARRIGTLRLMTVGAGCGFAANICFATTGSAAGLLTGQVLMGAVGGLRGPRNHRRAAAPADRRRHRVGRVHQFHRPGLRAGRGRRRNRGRLHRPPARLPHPRHGCAPGGHRPRRHGPSRRLSAGARPSAGAGRPAGRCGRSRGWPGVMGLRFGCGGVRRVGGWGCGGDSLSDLS